MYTLYKTTYKTLYTMNFIGFSLSILKYWWDNLTAVVDKGIFEPVSFNPNNYLVVALPAFNL